MNVFLKILVHVAPVFPLFWGRPYLAIALLLFLLLCYIKVFKLKQQLTDLSEQGGDPKVEASVRNAMKRWHSLTWLGPL
jgi:hypothetical protein